MTDTGPDSDLSGDVIDIPLLGCPRCGGPLSKPRTGPMGAFCSKRCYDAAYRERERRGRRERLAGRACQADGCDNPLPEGATAAKRYCDDRACYGKRRYAAVKNDPERYEAHKDRAKEAMAKRHAGLAPIQRVLRSLERRMIEGARRVHEAGGVVENFDLLRDVIGPSRLACYICGGRVAFKLGGNVRPDPLSVGIDHVIAIGEPGGDHTVANLAVVHHGCNARKQDRGLDWARAKSPRRAAPPVILDEIYAYLGAFAATGTGRLDGTGSEL